MKKDETITVIKGGDCCYIESNTPVSISVMMMPTKLRVNGLLAPNKTEREYYDYQAKKGAKA